jgi:uncharacterized protein YndB with AHSA1/START domain
MVEKIERELLLPAPPEDVWELVTGPGWLADDVQLELVPGGDAWFCSDSEVRTGWVEEALVPGSDPAGACRLAFWWSANGDSATRVELVLDPVGEDATRLRVVEARPLDVLDLVGIPLPGSGGAAHGPALLAAV